jgi:hypothetical protein
MIRSDFFIILPTIPVWVFFYQIIKKIIEKRLKSINFRLEKLTKA